VGVTLEGFRSRMLTAELVDQADYIFGMTRGHVEGINLLYPHAAEKTFLLREFDESLGPYEKDIADPIGGSLEVYLTCRDQLEQGIASLLKFIDQTNPGLSDMTDTPRFPPLCSAPITPGSRSRKRSNSSSNVRACHSRISAPTTPSPATIPTSPGPSPGKSPVAMAPSGCFSARPALA
jgi:hypothetical protein